MAKNQKFAPSKTRHFPVPDGTLSGTPLLVGVVPCIALTTEGQGGNADNEATIALDGCWRVPVTTTTALAVGAPVYITPGGALTPVSSGNTLWGTANEAKGTAAATVAVEISQV